jgi:gamma-glutamyl-gamma-aminobutyrate hydrolase PuuD
VAPGRDRAELALLRAALAEGLPVLASAAARS